ncbi:MAG: hypothetical protein IJT44_06575 [Clostridia bacterium]|nr:hypothetical protein [Clostridia bacterium]
MQDRYAGDIGDYGKIALLKELHNQGLSIGVNWYKTEPLAFEIKRNGGYKQNDGAYGISQELKECDPVLAEKLTKIAKSDDRSIRALEKADLIPGAAFFSDTVPVDNREAWHANALSFFRKNNADLIFLDPDNGLLVPSAKKGSPRSVKYAYYEEVAYYLDAKQSVLIYNHRSRKNELEYFREIESRLREKIPETLRDTELFTITFPRFSVRDYFAIPASPEHAKMIQNAFSTMLSGIWKEKRMCQKPITAGATYSEYRARFKSKNDFLKHYRSLPKETVMEMINLSGANTTVKACMASIWNNNK